MSNDAVTGDVDPYDQSDSDFDLLDKGDNSDQSDKLDDSSEDDDSKESGESDKSEEDDRQDDDEQDEDDKKEKKSRVRKSEKDEDEDEDEVKDDQPAGSFKTNPTYSEIKKEFPDLFKKFPQLKHVFYREGKYAEIFPTVDEARDAAETVENFRWLEKQIIGGESQGLLQILGQHDRKSYRKFVDGLLPTLYNHDKDSFIEVTRPVLRAALAQMHKEGKRAGNDAWTKSAIEALEFFDLKEGGDRRDNDRGSRDDKDPEREQFERERNEFNNSRLMAAKGQVYDVMNSTLNKSITGLLDKDDLTDFQKRNILRDVREEIDRVLTSDKRHMDLMSSLWKRAEKSGFSREYRERIIQAYRSQVDLLIPGVVRKIKSEALGSSRKSRSERDSGNEDSRRRSSGDDEKPVKVSGGGKKVDWSKTSDLDFLNGKETFK